MGYLENLWNALDFGSLRDMVLRLVSVFLCLTVHETCHGLAAYALGDPTAKRERRLSLNPLHHIDWFGLAAMLLVGFGWAKPVPINFRNLRNPKTDMIWVAAAGPGANLIQAILWAIVLKFLISMGIYEDFFIKMCVAGVSCNIVLMALNLIPIPPLDGGRIVTGLLPPGMAWQYSRIEPYGMWILFALILTGTLSIFMRPFMRMGQAIVQWFI